MWLFYLMSSSRRLRGAMGINGGREMNGRVPQPHLLAISLAVVCACSSVQAIVYHVDDSAPAGGDGLAWSTCFDSLVDALALAASDDEIRVAQGIYKPTTGTDRSATFSLLSGVSLLGGYAGYGATDPNTRDISAFETVLSGDIGTTSFAFDNSYHVLTASGADATALLSGFTITAGKANGSSDNARGAGMYSYSGSPTVTDCTFIANAAQSTGGAIHNVQSSSPVLTRCTFVANEAYWGGAIANDDFSDPCIVACKFLGNDARFDGGAIYNGWRSNPALLNCLLSGNTADRGAGVFSFEHSKPLLINCTVVANQADDVGAGIYTILGPPFEFHLINCIFWGNTDKNGAGELAQSAGSVQVFVDYSCIQSWTGTMGGTGNVGDDPCFVDADGPDNTAGTDDDNVRLLANSPCIDTAHNASLPAGVDRDLDSRDRIRNGNCTGPATVDMGAHEFTFADQGDINGDCFVDLGDFEPFAAAWQSQPHQTNWNPNCNIALPPDNIIDDHDLLIIIQNWLTSTP